MELQNILNEQEWNPLDFTFTLIVDFLAAISFCVSVTEGGIKSVVILFGITYLYSFYNERKNYYGKQAMAQELKLTNWGCIISIFLLLACVMVGIGFADVGVQNSNGNPKIILESGQGSILHWNSIRITYLLLGVFMYPTFIHIAVGVTKYLRTRGFDVEQVKKYIQVKWYLELVTAALGVIVGCLVCKVKFWYYTNFDEMVYFGEPQYYRYGFLFGIFGLIFGWVWQGRKNLLEQKNN